jgi:hypothetical protein
MECGDHFAALVSLFSGGRVTRNSQTRESGEIDRRTPKKKHASRQ